MADKKKQQDLGESKRKRIYDLYRERGLIKTSSFQEFSNINEEQQEKIFEVGRQEGIFDKTTVDDFKSIFKKKEPSQPSSSESEVTSQISGSRSNNSSVQPADPTLVNIPADDGSDRLAPTNDPDQTSVFEYEVTEGQEQTNLFTKGLYDANSARDTDIEATQDLSASDEQGGDTQSPGSGAASQYTANVEEQTNVEAPVEVKSPLDLVSINQKGQAKKDTIQAPQTEQIAKQEEFEGAGLPGDELTDVTSPEKDKGSDSEQKDSGTAVGRGLPGDELTDVNLEPKQESGVGSTNVVSTQESEEEESGAPSKAELEQQGRVLQDIFKEYEKIQTELEQTSGPGQINYSMMQFSSEQIEEAEQKRNELKKALENQSDLLRDKIDGISSGVINSENYERYLYTNDDGIEKVDYEKVSAQANQITNQLGLNSNSYVNELFENRLTAAARAQRDMPKIQEKISKKIKDEFGASKKKLAKQAKLPDTKEEALDRTVQDATERMLSYAAARESINKSSEEEFGQVKERVQEQSKAVTETLKQQKQEIESQVSEIKGRLQRGEISQEQADSMIGELKDGWEEQRESAKNKLAESISEMTEMQGRINEKAQANLAKYKKLSLRNRQSPFDQQTQRRLEEITKNAYKEVEAEKRERAKEIEDSLYDILPGDGFAPISAVNSVIGTALELNRSFYESLGGGIEGLGQNFQLQSLENFGTGMKREDATYQNRDLSFSDYLNPRNAADMTGNVLGSMLPSFVASGIATGAVTLTGGTSAPAVALAMGAGGAAAWGTETAQIAGRDWQRAIAQGKSEREANRIYNERWQSQALMAPLYATEAVPFLGKSITTSVRASRAGQRVGRGLRRATSAAPESVRNFGLKSAKFGRIGAAAGTEYVTEFGQEFTQQSFGKIIEDDKSFNDLFSVMSAEDAKSVAAEILPVVIFGGGGQAVSEVQMAREQKRAKKRAEDFEKFVKKSVTKDRTSDYAPHLGRQHIFNVTKKEGPKTAMAVVNSLVSSGQVKQEEAKQLITAVSSSERALDEANDAGLSEDAASVYGALKMKRDQTAYEVNAAQGEAVKNAKQEELNQIDEKLNELAQTGGTDIVTVKHKGGQSNIITPDEARKLVQDEEIQAAMQNGDFQISVQAKEGGKNVTELTKEISEVKREADLDTKDETENLTVEEQEIAQNVRADSEVSNMTPQQRPQKIAEKYGVSQEKADKIASSVYKRELDAVSNQYKVDPERGYTYEVESENELPATLADKEPIGKTEANTREGKTITYTFSGQQLIESGLASEATESANPNEEEGTPLEQQSQGEAAVDVPPPEPKQLPAGATPKPLPEASISSYDGEFVTFEGAEGYLDVDESGKVTVESADGKQVFELGNLGDPAAEAQFEKVSLAPTPEQVVQEDGSIQVYNKTFTGDVQANTTTDSEGNILNVRLQDSKGNTRTFRGELAERIVYEDLLRRLENRSEESVTEVEATLTSNAEIKQKIDNAQSKRKRQIEKRQGKAKRSGGRSKSQGVAASGQSSGRQTQNEWSQEELEQFRREVEQEQLENVEKEIEAFKERNKSYFRKDGKMKGNAPKSVKRDFQDLIDILEYKQILDAEAQAEQAGQRSEVPTPTQQERTGGTTQTGQGQGQQGQGEGTGGTQEGGQQDEQPTQSGESAGSGQTPTTTEPPTEEQSTDLPPQDPPQDPPPQNPPELPGSGTTGTALEGGQQGTAPTQRGDNTGTTGTAGTAGTTGAAGTGGQASEEFGPEQNPTAYESSTTVGDLVVEEVGRRQEEGNDYQREEEFNKDPRLAALQAKKDELGYLENGEYEAETGEEAPADAIESLKADIELLTQSLEAEAQRDDQIAAELEQIQKQDNNGQEEGQQPVLEGLQDGGNQNEERREGSELRPKRKERKEEQKQVVTKEGDVVVFTQPKKGERAPEFRLVRQPDGTLEIKSRKTGKVSTNRNTRKNLISQYIRSEKIAADGKTSQEAIDDGDVTMDDVSEEALYDPLVSIIETSTNPAQLASAYQELFYNQYYLDPETQLDPIEYAILQAGIGDIDQSSFVEAKDKNLITDTMAKAYRFRTRKGTGIPLDVIAMEASGFIEGEDSSGTAVTPEDVADFIVKYPQGPKQALYQRNPKLDQAYEKFKEVTGLEPNPNTIETILDSYAKLQETEAELRNDANEGTSGTPAQQGTKVPEGSGQSRSTTDTNLSQTKKGEGKKKSGQSKQSGQQSKQSSVGEQGAPAFREDESVEDYAKRVGYENIHMAVNSVFKNLGKSVTKETITKQDVADASQVSESLNQGDTSYSEKGQELSRELQNAGTTKEAKDWFFEQYKKSTGELTPTDISALFEEYKKRFKELKQQEEERIRQQQNEVEEQARQGPDDVDPNIMASRQKNRKGRRLINEAVRRLKKSFPNIQVNILTEKEFYNKFREYAGERPTFENDQGIYGFVSPYDGQVYLNERVSSEETAFEEFSHIWLRILEEANPAVYDAAIAKAKKTGSYSDLLQVYDEYTYKAVAEEVLAHEMAAETARRFEGEGALKRSVRTIFQALGRLLRKVGLAYDPTANVGRLTIDKLAKYASKDLLSSVAVSSISSSELAKIQGSQSTSFSLSDDIKGSILRAKDETFYEAYVRGPARFYLTAPVDQSSGLMSFSERLRGESRAASERAAQQVDDLKVRIDEHVREQADNDNKDAYVSKLLEDVNSAFRGEIAMEELRQRYSKDIYDKAVDLRIQVDKISQELARQRVVAHGDAVGQINEDLAMYLQNNFRAAEHYKQTLKEASEVNQQRKREISLMTEEQLDEEKQRLQYEVAEKQKRLKEKKLERLQGMIANQEHRNSRNQTPRLKKQIEKVYKQIEKLRVEGQEEGPQVSTQELDKEIEDARTKLQEVYDRGLSRDLTPEEQALFDELAQAQDLLESAQGSPAPSSLQEKRVEVQQIANSDKRLSDRIAQHDAQDLGVVEIEYKRTSVQDAREARQARDAEKEEGEESEPLTEVEKREEPLADINLLHQNGKQTPLYNLDRETVRRLFGSQGDEMAEEVFGGTNEGIKRIGSPRVLQDNTLYQTIMDNLGKYTHRSYMLHDYADFAKDTKTLKNYIGYEHYLEGFSHIKGKLNTGRIKKVTVQRTGNPNRTNEFRYLVTYYNEYDLPGTHDNKKVISYKPEEIDNMKVENNGPLDSETVDRIRSRLQGNESEVTETAKSGKTLTDEQSVIKFSATNEKVERFIIETLRKTGANNESLFAGAPVKGMDTNVLKERKDIEEPIRKLMGEYMNPYVNIYKTLVGSHMALSNQRLVNELMDNENIFISRKETSQHTVPIDNSKLMGLGQDDQGNPETMYMRRDAYDALFNPDLDSAATGFFHALRIGSQFTKLAFTVASPETQARNFWGAGWAMLTSGNANFADIPQALGIVSQDFGKKRGLASRFFENFGALMSAPISTVRLLIWGRNNSFGFRARGNNRNSPYTKRELRGAFNELVQYGLIGEQLEAGLMQDLIQSNPADYSQNFVNKFKGTTQEAFNEGLNNFSKVYRYGDEMFKAVAWLNEMEVHREAYKADLENNEISDDQIKAMVADKIRNHQPTYSRVPRIISQMSASPIFGSFIQFHAERYRNIKNIYADAFDEIRSGREALRKKGLKRMASATATAGLYEGFVSVATGSLVGLSGDDDEAVAALSSDWAANAQRLYVSDDTKKPQFVDLSYIDPNGMVGRAVNAVLFSRTTKEGIYDTINELGGPLLTMGIFVSKLINVLVENETSTGAKVYPEGATNARKVKLGIEQLADEQKPKFVKSGSEIYSVLRGKETAGAQELKLGTFFLNKFLGFKTTKIDMGVNPKKAVSQYQFSKVYNRMNSVRTYDDDESKKEGLPLSEEELEKRNTAAKRHFEHLVYLHEQMEQLGFSKEKIRANMKEGQIPKYLMEDIENKEYPGINPETGLFKADRGGSRSKFNKPDFGKPGFGKPSFGKPDF